MRDRDFWQGLLGCMCGRDKVCKTGTVVCGHMVGCRAPMGAGIRWVVLRATCFRRHEIDACSITARRDEMHDSTVKSLTECREIDTVVCFV